MVQVPGKRSRRVPIILTPEAKVAMDLLVKHRNAVEIHLDNPYFFASDSANGHLDGYTTLRSVAVAAETDNPERITSTNFRKYCATVTQVCCANSVLKLFLSISLLYA